MNRLFPLIVVVRTTTPLATETKSTFTCSLSRTPVHSVGRSCQSKIVGNTMYSQFAFFARAKLSANGSGIRAV